MLKSLLKRLRQKPEQHEDLTQPIYLGELQTDGPFDYEWTSRRIDDITKQLRKLEKIGRHHTRKIIFNKPQTIYTFLEIIKKASKEIALKEIEKIQTQRKLSYTMD